jgi:hypothetical protein
MNGQLKFHYGVRRTTFDVLRIQQETGRIIPVSRPSGRLVQVLEEKSLLLEAPIEPYKHDVRIPYRYSARRNMALAVEFFGCGCGCDCTFSLPLAGWQSSSAKYEREVERPGISLYSVLLYVASSLFVV